MLFTSRSYTFQSYEPISGLWTLIPSAWTVLQMRVTARYGFILSSSISGSLQWPNIVHPPSLPLHHTMSFSWMKYIISISFSLCTGRWYKSPYTCLQKCTHISVILVVLFFLPIPHPFKFLLIAVLFSTLTSTSNFSSCKSNLNYFMINKNFE